MDTKEYNELFPFGISKITVHVADSTRRVIIDPVNPASVAIGLMNLVGHNIEKVVIKDKINPAYDLWRSAVEKRETMLGFDEWSTK